MKTLKPLVDLVHKQDNFNVASRIMEARGGYIMRRLYEGIAAGVYETDADARKDLYCGEQRLSNYSELKKRLLKTLAGVFLFIFDEDGKSDSSFESALAFCKKQVVALDFMVLKGQALTARKLLERVYTISKKFHITDAHEKACELMTITYAQSGDLQTVEQYEREREVAESTLAAEKRGRMIVRKLMAPNYAKMGNRDEESYLAESLQEMRDIASQHTSFQLERDLFRVENYVSQMVGNYEAAFQACVRYKSFCETHPHLLSKGRLAELNIHMAHNLFHLLEHEEGVACAEVALENLTKGTDNWYYAAEACLLNLTHVGEYKSALELAEEVRTVLRTAGSREELVEKWDVFGSLLHLQEALVSGEATECVDLEFHARVKDHRGVKVIAMIVEIVSHLGADDFDSVLSKGESLKRFINRYTKDQDKRATAFLKCLEIMIRQNFHYDRTYILTEKHVQKLKGELAKNIDQLEIIPYDQLWEIVLDKLREIESSGKVYQAKT